MSNSLDAHDCNCKLANILHGLCLALRVHSAFALGFYDQSFGWSVSVPFKKCLCLCLKILLFPFLLFALLIFKGLIEITPSFLPRFFKMTSQTKSNVYDREWRWHLSMSCVSGSTFKCLTATACLPMSPPSSFKQSFPQRKAKVAAIVIVIVVKTYKIQGRKPGGKVKQQSSVECLTKIQDSEWRDHTKTGFTKCLNQVFMRCSKIGIIICLIRYMYVWHVSPPIESNSVILLRLALIIQTFLKISQTTTRADTALNWGGHVSWCSIFL